MLNPVGGQSLTKSHICVTVTLWGRVCEQSGASTISLPRFQHLKGSQDVISSFAFSLECYKLIGNRSDP